MAVSIWGPDPALPPNRAGDHRFLFGVETGGLLYVLVQQAVPAEPWPAPHWMITATLARPWDLPYATQFGAADPDRIATAMYGAPDRSVEAITVTLDRGDTTVMTARAVRRDEFAGDTTFAIWEPEPLPLEPASGGVSALDGNLLVVDGERTFRPLVGVETADAWYVLVEGPTARQPDHPWTMRATGSSGDLPVRSVGGGHRKRSPLVMHGTFAAPDPGVAELDLIVERDHEQLISARYVRRARPA
jgi:hypothetical protein